MCGPEEEQNLKSRPFVLSLRKGEVEVLDVIATARTHYYEWVLELTEPGVFTLREVPKEDIECDPASQVAVCA
jgi:hypothetical protein